MQPEPTLYDVAVALVLRHRQCSTTWLMRALPIMIGYNRCALLCACMEFEGIVGRVDAENRRDVLAWLQ